MPKWDPAWQKPRQVQDQRIKARAVVAEAGTVRGAGDALKAGACSFQPKLLHHGQEVML